MNTDIKRIRDIIEKETGINLDIATRKREAVLARRMYYTILKRQTKMSLNDIGATLKLKQDHATVLHQTKMFDRDYEQDKMFRISFKRIMNVIDGVIELSEEEKLKDKNTKLNYKLKKLKDEIAELKKEVEYLRPKAIQPRNQQTKVYHCSEGISGSIY